MQVKNHLFKERMPLWNSALDAYALRQKTIAKNIANVNTPDYRPEKVKFEEVFREEREVLKGHNSNFHHLAIGPNSGKLTLAKTYKTEIDKGELDFSGDNSVNIDKEMSELAQNQIRARFTSQMVSKYFKSMSSAITGQQGQ